MIRRLLATLKIRPDEARMAAQVALFFCVIDLSRAIGDSAADALFFRRFGVEYLPYLYIALGILTFGASLGYAVCVGRLAKRRFFPGMLLGMALLLLVERGAILLNLRALYPLLWLTINVNAALLGILVWTTAGETCDTRQAKRLFPIFVSSSILGDLLGSLIIGPAAQLLGTENLVVLDVLLLAAAAWVIRGIARGNFRPVMPSNEASSFLTDIRAGFETVKRTPLLQLLGVSAVLFSVLYFSVAFPFGKAVSAAYTSEAQLAGFLGLFKGISSALMFVAALLIANRLYARIGIVFALLLLPVTYLLGFILFAADFTFTTAVIVRLAQLVVLSGIGDGAYSSFFNVVPAERRAQVRAFDAGVPSQIGIILSGLLLILGERLLTNTSIFGMGMVVAVLCALVVWRMRRSYGDALVAALRAGRVEVFSGGERIFTGLANNLEANRILIAGLDAPQPVQQQLAAEMLARIQANAAAPALIERLPLVTGEVRAAFIRALGQLGARAAARPVAGQLRDASAAVRCAALDALPELSAPAGSKTAVFIHPLLADPDITVRIQAAISLARCGESGAACRALLELMQAALDEPARIAVLQAFEPVFRAAGLAGDVFDHAALEAVMSCAQEASSAIRQAACQGLASVSDPAALKTLVGCLSDPVQAVRAQAARALRTSAAAAPLVLVELPAAADPAMVLEALSPGDRAIAAPLRSYARVELSRMQAWRDARRALPVFEDDLNSNGGNEKLSRRGRATEFLASLLEDRAQQAEGRFLKVVGLLSNEMVMEVVARSLKTANPDTRATAIEALDTLGDKQLVKAILPWIEESSQGDTRSQERSAETGQVLSRLMAGEDTLLRAVAMRAAGELGLMHLSSRPSEGRSRGIGTQAAAATGGIALADGAEVWQQSGGVVETLQTLPLVERTILLREISLFSDLSADDLVQIARMAEERWFEDGAVLCHEGDKGDTMFMIAEGQVRVTRQVKELEQELAIRNVGDIVGEMAIIDSVPRFATLTADGEVRTLVITADAFKAILRDRPEVSLAVMRSLSRRLRE
jgi:HEAT repeat protein